MTDPNAQPPVDPNQGQPQQPYGGQVPPQQPPQQPFQGQVPPQQPYAGQVPPQQPYAGQTPPPQYGAPVGSPPLTQAEDKQWAAFGHFGGVLGFLPPLIIWLVFKDRGPFTNQEAKESLNFQITIAIAELALYIVGLILTFVVIGAFLLPLVPLVWLLGVIFAVIGGVKVNSGQAYRYPFAIRFIK